MNLCQGRLQFCKKAKENEILGKNTGMCAIKKLNVKNWDRHVDVSETVVKKLKGRKFKNLTISII